MTHTLPQLSYDYAALEPHIDARTMEIHHSKHHATYIAKLNDSVSGTSYENTDIETLISDISSLPSDIQASVRNNGGGHYNHSFFWKSLKLGSGDNTPTGSIIDKINASFGSYDEFKTQFANAAATRFGSGWAWLCQEESGDLFITSTANQDNPLMQGIS